MFVADVVEDFFNVILDQRVAIFVSFDIDALCACKILEYLLQCEQRLYSVIPVTGIRDLERAFRDYVQQIKHFVLINCGGNVNLVELLQPDDDVIFFISDSHRPLDVFNVYNKSQVRLLPSKIDLSGGGDIASRELDEDFPTLESVYRDEDEEDEDDDDNSQVDNDDDDHDDADDADGAGDGSEADEETDRRARKRRRLDDIVERRIERRNWEKEREKILFEYGQFTYYGPSTAIVFFDLSSKMCRDNNDLLWWATIGLTETLVNHKCERSDYILQAGILHLHLVRLNCQEDDDDRNNDVNGNGNNGRDVADGNSTSTAATKTTPSIHSLKLSFDKDLQLALHRHWTLHKSFEYTAYTACQFRLWTQKGKKKLAEFFADIGLPLVQCKQHYSSMDMFLRNNVKSWIEAKSEKYGLDRLMNGAFFAQFGYKHKFCSADFVYASSALLESTDAGKSPKDSLLDALACLSRHNRETIDRGIDAAKRQMVATFQQVQMFLDLNLVISAGPFLYAVVTEGAPGTAYFGYPVCLVNLAHCLLRAHVSSSRNRKTRNLPLVLVAPCKAKFVAARRAAYDTETSYQLVVGIPPLSEDSEKNFFGQAFLQAGIASNANTIHDNFDSCIVHLPTDYNGVFFDSLTSILN